MTGAARLQVEVRLSSFDHPKSDLEDVILRHPFTSSLELLFPVRRDCVLEKAYTRGDMRYLALEELLLSAELRLPLHRRRHQTVTVTSQNCSTDTGGALTGGRLEEVYFYSAELSLAQFAQPEFVSAYIASAASGAAADLASAGAGGQRGGFYALSTDSQRLEGADAAAVTPDGILHLSLTRDSYQRLGVTGTHAPGGKYLAELSLASRNFQPGRRHYERVTALLEKNAPAPQRFLCARCTPTGAPLPVAFPPAASARRLQAPHAAHHVSGLRLPPLERLFGGSAEEAAGAAADTGLLSALHEWLGAVACGAHGSRGEANMLWRTDGSAPAAKASTSAFEPYLGEGVALEDGWAELHRWEGLLCPEQVWSAVRFAAGRVRGGHVPWAAVSAWGWRRAAVAWHDRRAVPTAGEDDDPAAAAGPSSAAASQPPGKFQHAGGANDVCVVLLPKERYLVFAMREEEQQRGAPSGGGTAIKGLLRAAGGGGRSSGGGAAAGT